jgi:hypothetical protein
MHERDVVETEPGILGVCTEPLQYPDRRVVVWLSFSAFDARQRGDIAA